MGILVGFIRRPLYAWGKAPGVRRMKGIEGPSASLHPLERENLLLLPGIKPFQPFNP
jgi:hypothetical protein